MDTRSTSSPALYRETQHFRQWWIWALVLFIAALSLYGAVQQIILGIPFGSNPAPDGWMIVIAIVFGIGLPIFMYVINLTTEVRSDGLYVRFFPLHLSFLKITPQEIKGFEACTYSPLGDYGGWGIRFGRKGKAYNISGNRGVQLELTNGKRLLIGSQRPEELVQTLTPITRRK
ncbi:MAG: hypothetical protein JXA46_07165 [Dehalococcoidales bacterium]|nr:hypothetical protein [Dehalococcoidales bacterium]